MTLRCIPADSVTPRVIFEFAQPVLVLRDRRQPHPDLAVLAPDLVDQLPRLVDLRLVRGRHRGELLAPRPQPGLLRGALRGSGWPPGAAFGGMLPSRWLADQCWPFSPSRTRRSSVASRSMRSRCSS